MSGGVSGAASATSFSWAAASIASEIPSIGASTYRCMKREIRSEAPVASKRNTQEHSRGRDLHADERGQTPSDGYGPRAHESESRPQLDLFLTRLRCGALLRGTDAR